MPNGQYLLEKGLSHWSSNPTLAGRIFTEVFRRHKGSKESELAQAYLYKLKNGHPCPDPADMVPDIAGWGTDGRPRTRHWFATLYPLVSHIYLLIFGFLALPALVSVLASPREVDVITKLMLTNIGLLSTPVFLLIPRVLRRYRYGIKLIPIKFAERRTVGTVVGKLLVALAVMGIVLDGVIGVLVVVTRQSGVPVGLGTGISMWPLAAGLLVVEISYRLWARTAEAI